MIQEPPNSVDPRVGLAERRTGLAAFRAKLALDRTTLTMASFGFGTVAFFRSLREANQSAETIRLHELAIRFGVALILVAIAATILASLSHWFSLRRLRRSETPVISQWPLSITVGMLLAVAGLVGLWSLLAG